MPIYVYRCPKCGHTQEALRKHSDPAPACPQCNNQATEKQPTAPAGFDLRGGGYYATDFK